MIKMEKFLISKGPYAIDPASLKATFSVPTRDGEPVPGAQGRWRCTVQAVWFRRRRQETVACIGELWWSFKDKPKDALEFAEWHTDGRYGGSTEGRWDGEGYWGNQVSLEEQAAHLEILRPMLANYPAVPPSYDGWWRF